MLVILTCCAAGVAAGRGNAAASARHAANALRLRRVGEGDAQPVETGEGRPALGLILVRSS